MEDQETSLGQLRGLAERGDADAQFTLGGKFYSGEDVSQDFAEASKWFREAANLGHAKAQFNLGYMCAVGEGTPQDLGEALQWYTRAAEQGLVEAQNNLANLYEQNQQFAEAVRWYRQAAEQGAASAQACLGYAFSMGHGVPVNEIEALKYYRMAAEQRFAPAQSNLGEMLANGRGVPADPTAAAHWTRLAADQGYAPAQRMLGYFLDQGFGVKKDSSEAIKWLLRAALQGLADAQNSLAIHYAEGNGIAEDKIRAFMWFAAAASQGNAAASQNKERLRIDESSEVCKLIDAAASGDGDAQSHLAVKLHDGEGIQQDADAARFWLRKAAEGGHAGAQTTYALILRGTEDPDAQRESVWWLSKAVEQGDDRARFNLGLSQAVGKGTTVDLSAAAVNLMQASLSGFEQAREAFEQIRPLLPAESLPSIFERVKWPDLSFVMGPLVEGHLDGIRISQENDDGSEEPDWLRYERDVANTTFLGSSDKAGSLLDAAFGEPVCIKQMYVGRALIDGKARASVNINLRNVHLADGFPVYWKPTKEGLDLVANMIGVLEARTWMRWTYFSR